MRFICIVLLGLLIACGNGEQQQGKDSEALPILGNKDVVDGKTIHHTIPDFQFVDQDSSIITNTTFKDKAYIVDFFFTSCPTICPKVKQQMLRIYDRFETEERLKLLSHSIDTRNDSVPRLKQYAEKLEVSSDRWHFVTGKKDD
ncbi:MAG: SCO family protein, partial [Bacteroidota bacterium]